MPKVSFRQGCVIRCQGPVEALSGLPPAASGFYADEKLVPLNVIASCGGTAAGKGLVQHLKIDDLVGFREEPVRNGTTAFAGGLVSE